VVAFADVATIAILQDQAVRDAEVRARQLSTPSTVGS
jgi:hypothetical protein